MHVSHDLYRWYPNVDPDFDEWGGELTLHQIVDPVPEGDEEPAHYLERKKARDYWARYTTRSLERDKRICKSRDRLTAVAARFDVAARSLNKRCNGCIPYNGPYTRKYWDPVQKPYRVDDFLR